MSKALRKLAGQLNKTSCTVIFINQLREKTGVIYGNPEVTSGGRALKFYASIRIDIRRGEAIKDNDGNIIGNNVRIKVVKNKVAPPFKVADTAIYFGHGLSQTDEVVTLAVQYDLVHKSGSWFSIGDEKIGQGLPAVEKYFHDHPDEYQKVYEQVRAKLTSAPGAKNDEE